MPLRRASAPNPRRYLITGAILLVAGVFLFRDRLLQDWSGLVDVASRALVDGRVDRPADPGLALVHDLAVERLNELGRPLTIEPADVSRDGSDLQAVVRVTGAGGRRVLLTWRGRPPQLTDVASGSEDPRPTGSKTIETDPNR